MKHKVHIIIVFVLLLALLLAGCSKGGQNNASGADNANNVQNNAAPANTANTENSGGSGQGNNTANTDNTAKNNDVNNANEAINGYGRTDNTENNAPSGNQADNTGNTETNSADNTNSTENAGSNANTAENTGNNAENANTAENTGNNAENTGNNANNTNTEENTSNNAEPDEYAVMKEITGVWYDQFSYGELTIEKDGSCKYSTYAGDFDGSVTAAERISEMDKEYSQFDLKIEGSYEDYPNLFYDKENDFLYYETGGERNLFSHEPHEYEPINWVYAMWGEDLLEYYPEHFEYIDDASENSRVVLFDTIREIENLCFTTVSITGSDDKGDPVFQQEILYTIDKLESGRGFAVRMVFPGDTPSNGILYTDPVSGEVRCYAVELSGFDGSLILTEF